MLHPCEHTKRLKTREHSVQIRTRRFCSQNDSNKGYRPIALPIARVRLSVSDPAQSQVRSFKTHFDRGLTPIGYDTTDQLLGLLWFFRSCHFGSSYLVLPLLLALFLRDLYLFSHNLVLLFSLFRSRVDIIKINTTGTAISCVFDEEDE